MFTSHKKGKPIISDNVGGSRALCGKWKKPDTEGQELYVIAHLCEIKHVDLMEVESRDVLTGGWGRGKLVLSYNKVRIKNSGALDKL